MRPTLVLIGLIGCSVTVSAQTLSVPISVKTLNDRPMVSLVNTKDSQIEAFLVTVDVAKAGKRLTRLYFDAHTYYRHDRPIPTGNSKEIPLPHVVGEDLPVPEIRAVIFSDGTTIGDGIWVEELLQRRRIVSDRLQEVVAILRDASKQNLTGEQTVAKLRGAQETRRHLSLQQTPEEQVLQEMIFIDAIKTLQNGSQGAESSSALNAKIERLCKVFGDWSTDIQTAKPSLAIPASR